MITDMQAIYPKHLATASELLTKGSTDNLATGQFVAVLSSIGLATIIGEFRL